MENSNSHIHDPLVRAAAKGKRSAQAELYRLYAKAMLNVSYRIIEEKESAEDVMHEAFISAFQKLDQFNFNSTFGSWLKRIVINKSLDHIKYQKMIGEKAEIFQSESHEAESDAEAAWSNYFSLEDIKLAAGKLAKNHSIVFQLYMIEGYDHEEIAEILGINSSTSRSQLSRAKQNLKKILLAEKV